MNLKQNICLWIGIAVIVVMGIFPPWTVGQTILSPQDGGYHFILSHQEVRSIDCYNLNTSRLLIQWTMVVVITGGLLITFKDKKKNENS